MVLDNIRRDVRVRCGGRPARLWIPDAPTAAPEEARAQQELHPRAARAARGRSAPAAPCHRADAARGVEPSQPAVFRGARARVLPVPGAARCALRPFLRPGEPRPYARRGEWGFGARAHDAVVLHSLRKGVEQGHATLTGHGLRGPVSFTFTENTDTDTRHARLCPAESSQAPHRARPCTSPRLARSLLFVGRAFHRLGPPAAGAAAAATRCAAPDLAPLHRLARPRRRPHPPLRNSPSENRSLRPAGRVGGSRTPAAVSPACYRSTSSAARTSRKPFERTSACVPGPSSMPEMASAPASLTTTFMASSPRSPAPRGKSRRRSGRPDPSRTSASASR